MRKLLSQRGFSLVSVLMAAAMMGGLALVVAQLGKNQSKIQSGATASSDINTFYNNVEKLLLNSKSCAATLSQITELPDNGSVFIDKIFSKIRDDLPPVEKYRISRDHPIGSIYIESIEVERKNSYDVTMIFTIKKLAEKNTNGAQIVKKYTKLFGKFNGNIPVGCYSQMDNAVSSAREEACKDIDPDATWTITGGCVLSDAFKKKMFEDGLGQVNTTPVYSDDSGVLSLIAPVKTVRCTISGKRCRRTSGQHCTPACPAGYVNKGPIGGRFDVEQSTWDKKCCRNYACTKVATSGTLISN